MWYILVGDHIAWGAYYLHSFQCGSLFTYPVFLSMTNRTMCFYREVVHIKTTEEVLYPVVSGECVLRSCGQANFVKRLSKLLSSVLCL
jgi:hypothetical protein